jgi:hypothetical protein
MNSVNYDNSNNDPIISQHTMNLTIYYINIILNSITIILQVGVFIVYRLLGNILYTIISYLLIVFS